MSALADFAHKFGSESRELKIGQSFFKDADTLFHTIRYDFVPASIDPNKTSAVDFGHNGKVTITMPNVEGSGTTESVYQGQHKPHQKECVLIIDNETGDLILERLNQGMMVKKARLRQEDLTGKSLALNKVLPPPASTMNGNGSHIASIYTNASQGKGNAGSDKKAPSVSSIKASTSSQNASKLQKHSPPMSHVNGTLHKSKTTTPSPPSMPIFSANTGSLVHMNGSVNNSNNENCIDRNVLSKPKASHVDSKKHSRNSAALASANRLSDSSSDSSDDNSDAESSSSQSSDSSSEDDNITTNNKTVQNKPASRSSTVLSMPSLSMPSLGSFPVSNSFSNTSTNAPPVSNTVVSNELKKPASLSLSEDSDSSDDERIAKTKPSIKTNKTSSSYSKMISGHNNATNKVDTTKPFLDSMPTFTNGTTTNTITTANYSSMPKFGHQPENKLSQLSQDLQLSESGSDSDD